MLNLALARERREQLGLTQGQLGQRLGVHQGAIANWELGKREPRVETLRAWARALGIELTDLLGEPEGAAASP